MIIQIGDVTLNDTILNPKIDGLGLPTIRTTDGNLSGRDGGWISSQFFKNRMITINGTLVGSSCSDLESKRRSLFTSLPIRQSMPMFITTFAGSRYYLDVYIIDFNMKVEHSSVQEFQIILSAPDPYLYDAGDGTDPDSGYIIQTVYRLVGGGYTFPYILPVEWEAGSTPTPIDNSGDYYLLPIITLEGRFTNPRLLNKTTGDYIELDITTTTGDVVIIDTKSRTVTLNGGSILPLKSGSWIGLAVGTNLIEFTSDSSMDESSATIKYRIAYGGL